MVEKQVAVGALAALGLVTVTPGRVPRQALRLLEVTACRVAIGGLVAEGSQMPLAVETAQEAAVRAGRVGQRELAAKAAAVSANAVSPFSGSARRSRSS